MRLTKKDYQFRPEDIVKLSSVKTADIYNKLGQLEDIEEELGIDLITLFNALFKGIFVRQDDGGIIFWRKPALRTDIKPYCLDFVDPSVFHCPKLSDYGKSWALTRGELK